MTAKTALVLRATGSQGKGVILHLVKDGWRIHALIRDPSSDRALALKKFGDGVSLFKGELNDRDSYKAAIQGCSAVFLNQMPSLTDDSEIQEARMVMDLAKEAGVEHVLLSTQLGLFDPDIDKVFSNPMVAPAVTGKLAAEKLVRESDIPWTILRPGWFNTNVLTPIVDTMYPGLSEGKFVSSYTPDMVLAAVDPDDIGAFAAAVLKNTDKTSGKFIPVVSEMITVSDMLSEIERASGKKLDIHYRTDEENERDATNPYIIGQRLTGDLARWADMDEIKKFGVPLTTFREFLQKNKDAVVPK